MEALEAKVWKSLIMWKNKDEEKKEKYGGQSRRFNISLIGFTLKKCRWKEIIQKYCKKTLRRWIKFKSWLNTK